MDTFTTASTRERTRRNQAKTYRVLDRYYDRTLGFYPGQEYRGKTARREIWFGMLGEKRDPKCTKCPLGPGCNTTCVWGSGSRKADIMLVLDSPGAREDDVGRAAVGDQGWKLNYLLRRSGLKRKNVYVTYLVKCRLPKSQKQVLKKHIVPCNDYLRREIATVKPKVIVTMGVAPMNALTRMTGLESHRGFWYESIDTEWDIPITPTFALGACMKEPHNDQVVIHDLKHAAKVARTGKLPKIEYGRYETLDSFKKAKAFITKLERCSHFVFDIESTGLVAKVAKLCGISFSLKSGEAAYLPFREPVMDKFLDKKGKPTRSKPFWTKPQLVYLQKRLRRVFRKKRIKKSNQNIKFDLQHIKANKMGPVRGIVFDPMIAHHCIDETKPHNLTFISCWYGMPFGRWETAMEAYWFGTGKKKHPRYDLVPLPIITLYAGIDADVINRLRPILEQELDDLNLRKAYNVEMSLIDPLADMEYDGPLIDRGRLIHIADQYSEEIERIKRRLKKLSGDPDFNPNSNPQVAALLKKSGAKLTKKTESGEWQMTKAVREELAAVGNKKVIRLVDLLNRMKYLAKHRSTYLDGKEGEPGGFLVKLDPENHIHTSYRSTTVTFRLASSDPNLQNLPRKGPYRALFLADRYPGEKIWLPSHETSIELVPGWVLQADYASVELRVAVYRAREMRLIKELRSGVDIHTENAVFALGIKHHEVTAEQRDVAKAITYGVGYGREPFTIALEYDLELDYVLDFLDAFWSKYGRLKKYYDKKVVRARKRRELVTPSGRRRHFHSYDWFFSREYQKLQHQFKFQLRHLDNEARNFEVQSWAAYWEALKTRQTWEKLRANKMKTRIMLTLHDALHFSVPDEELVPAVKRIPKWMKVVLGRGKPYEMDLPVDLNLGRNWGKEGAATIQWSDERNCIVMENEAKEWIPWAA